MKVVMFLAERLHIVSFLDTLRNLDNFTVSIYVGMFNSHSVTPIKEGKGGGGYTPALAIYAPAL
jgi:hypothetical protein